MAFVQCPSTTRGLSSPWAHGSRCQLNGTLVRQRYQLRRGRKIAMVHPVEVSEANFGEEVLSSDVPVLVDFYAGWCGPCKLVAPLMDWAATTYDGKLKVAKVDTEKNEKFVQEYGIHGLPTFAVFVNGNANGVQEGAMGKAALEQYIAQYVPGVGAVDEDSDSDSDSDSDDDKEDDEKQDDGDDSDSD